MLSLVSAIMASQLYIANAAPAPQASIVPTGRTYYLKTISNRTAFADLYVEAYHTGAGFNDAVLVQKGSPNTLAATGFLNGTYQEFNLGDDFPWGMVMTEAAYGSWQSVQINAGFGSQGFYFNNTDGTGRKGLKWVDGWPYELAGSPGNDWNGWLACNWAHGLPQLFWLSGSTPRLPCSCAQVELVREFTD